MRISERTPVLAILLLVVAVAVGLGFWYVDVRHDAETERALVQTREAFERFERERKSIAEQGRTPAAAATPVAPPAPTAAMPSPGQPPVSRARAAASALDVNYLLAALLATTVVALGLAGSSYRLVQRERRARMEYARMMHETPPERTRRFDDAEGNIIDAEPVGTVADGTPVYSPGSAPPRDGLEPLREWTEASTLPAIILRATGEVVALNRAFTRLMGYGLSDLPNLQAWLGRVHRIPPDDQPAARDAMRARFMDGDAPPAEMTVWTRNGEPRHWMTHAFTAPAGSPDAVWLLLASDITERKKAEHAAVEHAEQARHEAEELAGAYRGAPIGLAVLDAQMHFVRVNDRLAEMTGLRAADHIGKPLGKLLPHVAATAEPVIQAVLQSGTPSGSQWISVRTPAHPKAERRWAIACTPLKDAGARASRVAMSAEDVTERHATEAEVRENEAALRAILERVHAPICVKDTQGRYVYANPAYESFVGAAPGQLRGRMDHDVLPWQAADRLHDADDEALAAARAVESQGSVQLRDGAVHYSASKIALRDAAGKPYAVCAVYTDWTARQHAEDHMKLAEARYRSIFETSPQPMFIDIDNRLVHVNAACVRLLAAQHADQLLGKSILDFIQQPGHEPFQERIQRALRRKPVDGALDVKMVRLDGTVLDAEIEAALYETAGERAVQIVARDVSQRRRADAALRESEARLRAALDHTPALIRIADADGAASYWNAQWQRHTGAPLEEGLGLRWTQLVHAEDRERMASALRDTRLDREPVVAEYRLRDRSGEYRWMLDVATPRHDETGGYAGYVGCLVDIDDRKRTEEALRADAARFRSVAENAPAPLWIEDERGFESTNAAFRGLLGIAAGESADWTARLHPEDGERYAEGRAQALRENAVVPVPVRVRAADGEYRHMIAALAPRSDLRGVVGALTDITDLRRAERAARTADERRNAFVAALASDLRTPLEPLRHAAEVLRLTGGTEARAREASDIVVRHAQYLGRLLEDALDLSEMLRRRLPLEPAVVEVGDAVHRAAEAARPIIEARGVALTLTLRGGRAQVHADARRLAQPLARLLDYCARRADPGAAVALTAEEHEGRVRIDIAVDRAALRDGEIEALFDDDAREIEAGADGGLALPLARRLLAMQGGTMTAVKLDAGMRVSVSLPLYDASLHAARDAAARGPNGHRRVLVVDRDPDTAASLRMLLQLQGHDVRIASGRETAVPAAREFHPDTVLIDTTAAAGAPSELVRALRLLPETAHAALMYVGTGTPPRDAEADGLFDHYLVKPVEPQALQRLLAQTSPTVH